jgi:hypothetical protein
MKTTLMLATMMTAAAAFAQTMIPDGTKIRVRLEQNLSSETAELGQTVDFAVTQEVRVGDAIVIANGARATGSIVQVERKKSFGRAGKLDFSIDRVQLMDGAWLNVRYTPQKNSGKGNGVKTGVLTAGLAVVFWPAAPLGFLIKGHEATIIKGRAYEVFSDDSVLIKTTAPATAPLVTRELPQAPAATLRQAEVAPPAAATVVITADVAGAEIEVDGMFVGSAPTTIQLTPGVHKIAVKDGAAAWVRDIQVTGGNVNIAANLAQPAVKMAKK